MLSTQQVDACRRQFPALSRQINGRPAVYFDGPAGTQTPTRVIDAMVAYLSTCNANCGGGFTTSRESDALLAEAHAAFADFLGAENPKEIVFGPNMTTLTFALSRALARTWSAGDEVVVTQLDHDANISPWVLAARDAGATIRQARMHTQDCTLDHEHLHSLINNKTRLVAVGCASNASGSINRVAEIVDWAHDAGALVFLDAVHYAPHALIDVATLECDFLACSPYKFFGPHLGVLWGRLYLLEKLAAYKLRPAPAHPPGKWMTGTQSHEAIAAARQAVEYLADVGRTAADRPKLGRRAALEAAFEAIAPYEKKLVGRLLAGLAKLPDVRVLGITDPEKFDQRCPTVSITHAHYSPQKLATLLDEHGIFTWPGNFYALQFSEALELEPEGMLRIGLAHYNTEEEVDRLLAVLAKEPIF